MPKINMGVFMWHAEERRSSRYGGFYLCCQPYNSNPVLEFIQCDEEGLQALRGHKVHIKAKVIDNRKSGHIGDLSLEIRPSKPEVGEVVDLGVGILELGRPLEPGYSPVFFLKPGDGRRAFWLDPHKFYRLHDQTVEVTVEDTNLNDPEAGFILIPIPPKYTDLN